jgi:hypothetical protein
MRRDPWPEDVPRRTGQRSAEARRAEAARRLRGERPYGWHPWRWAALAGVVIALCLGLAYCVTPETYPRPPCPTVSPGCALSTPSSARP